MPVPVSSAGSRTSTRWIFGLWVGLSAEAGREAFIFFFVSFLVYGLQFVWGLHTSSKPQYRRLSALASSLFDRV